MVNKRDVIDGEYRVIDGEDEDESGEVVFLPEYVPPGEIRVWGEGEDVQGIVLMAEDLEEVVGSLSLVEAAQRANPDTLSILQEQFPSLRPGIDEAKYLRLQQLKEKMAQAFHLGNTLMMFLAGTVLRIERERLFEAEINWRTSEPYRNMAEYYPDLLASLQRATMHKLSKRQLQAYIAIQKVFVESLNIHPDVLDKIGVSNATELLEAADYNPRTGEVAETPKPGKLGKNELLSWAETVAREGLSYTETKALVDEARGVSRKSIHITWASSGITDAFVLVPYITIFEGGVPVGGTYGLTKEWAEWFTKRLGASSNLEEISG